MAVYLRLCLVTNSSNTSLILQAVQGGVTSVQLRIKNETLEEVRQQAKELKAILSPLNIPLIINDNVDIAREIDADGVHLGQSDISPVEARKLLGPNKIIGWSIETLDELEKANQLSCINYVAASAVFPSKTKLDCKTIWGLDGLKKIVEISKHPVIGIGGINIKNIRDVIKTGASGVAVVSAIHDALDPKTAAANLIEEMNRV